MARWLSELTDKELEQRFLEAEHNALVWADLDSRQAATRGSRWMLIAGELRAELQRRAGSPKPVRSRRRR